MPGRLAADGEGDEAGLGGPEDEAPSPREHQRVSHLAPREPCLLRDLQGAQRPSSARTSSTRSREALYCMASSIRTDKIVNLNTRAEPYG